MTPFPGPQAAGCPSAGSQLRLALRLGASPSPRLRRGCAGAARVRVLASGWQLLTTALARGLAQRASVFCWLSGHGCPARVSHHVCVGMHAQQERHSMQRKHGDPLCAMHCKREPRRCFPGMAAGQCGCVAGRPTVQAPQLRQRAVAGEAVGVLSLREVEPYLLLRMEYLLVPVSYHHIVCRCTVTVRSHPGPCVSGRPLCS